MRELRESLATEDLRDTDGAGLDRERFWVAPEGGRPVLVVDSTEPVPGGNVDLAAAGQRFARLNHPGHRARGHRRALCGRSRAGGRPQPVVNHGGPSRDRSAELPYGDELASMFARFDRVAADEPWQMTTFTWSQDRVAAPALDPDGWRRPAPAPADLPYSAEESRARTAEHAGTAAAATVA